MSFPEKRKKRKEADFEHMQYIDTELIETGVLPFDIVLGGGIEKGDLLEISSESGLGKSTLLLTVCRNMIKKGLKVAYCDVEKGVKRKILKSMGLEKSVSQKIGDPFWIGSPATFDDLDELFELLIFKHQYDLIVVDSITACMPAKLRDKAVADIEIGLHARQTTSWLMKYKPELRVHGTICVLINQMRTKMEISKVPGRSKVGKDSAGGEAMKFMPDVRIRMEKGPQLTRDEKTVRGVEKVIFGNNAYIFSHEKNRNERSGIKMSIPIVHGQGVSNIMSLLEIMKVNEILTGGHGGNYKVLLDGEEHPVRGQKALYAFIKVNYAKLTAGMRREGMFKLTHGEIKEP